MVAAAGLRSQPGAYWVMKRATATPSGTAMRIAMVEVTTVAQKKSSTPKRGSGPLGTHSREVRKLALLFSRLGTACTRRKVPIRATRATTRMPDAFARPPKIRSPRRPVEAGAPFSAGARSGPGDCSTTDRPVMVGVTLASSLSWFRGRAGSRPAPWLRWRGQRLGVLVRRAP